MELSNFKPNFYCFFQLAKYIIINTKLIMNKWNITTAFDIDAILTLILAERIAGESDIRRQVQEKYFTQAVGKI